MPEFGQFTLYTHQLPDAERAVVTRVLDHFRQAQDLIEIVLHGERELPGTGRFVVDCDVLARANRPVSPEIVITGLKLSDNWFSHTWGIRSIITAVDWDVAFAESPDAPPSAPDAYLLEQLTCAILLTSAGLPEREFGHDRTSGCLADMCWNKPDLAIKLRSGFLCSACRDGASAVGISGVYLDAIQSLLDRVRLLALGRTPQRKVPSPEGEGDNEYLERAETPPGFGVPGSLTDALRAKALTVIVGSGLSLQSDVTVEYPSDSGWAALPSWSEIGTRLADRLNVYKRSSLALRPTETLSEFLIELESLRERLGSTVYYPRAIFDIFLPRIRSTGRANRLVFRLPVRWVLTTNYDFVLNYSSPSGTPTYTWRESTQAAEYITRARGAPPLLKVHGCASRPNTVVLTSREYDELSRSQEYQALTARVFGDQPVLFLGFGLDDPFDLDLALRSANLSGAAQGEKFALLPEGRAASVRSRFPNVHVMPYRQHADVPAIIASLARESAA